MENSKDIKAIDAASQILAMAYMSISNECSPRAFIAAVRAGLAAGVAGAEQAQAALSRFEKAMSAVPGPAGAH